MKLKIFIVAILSCACNHSSQKQATNDIVLLDSGHIVDSNIICKEGDDEMRTNGDRQSKDSAHFHIIRRYYTSGARYLEVYENKLTNLDDSKTYFENGQLKEEGQMISVHHIPVGKWKYYSPDGKLLRTIDYDKKSPVSYNEALKIAKKYGYSHPDLDIYLSSDSSDTYWQIMRKSEQQPGQSASFIKISTRTGKVIIPKEQIYTID